MKKLTYTEIYTEDGVLDSVFRSDGVSIPANPANSDYQAYLVTLPSNSSKDVDGTSE